MNANTNKGRKRFLYDSDNLHIKENPFGPSIGSDTYYMQKKIALESKPFESNHNTPLQAPFELPDELCSQALSDVEKQNIPTALNDGNVDDIIKEESSKDNSILAPTKSKRFDLSNETDDIRNQFIKQSGEITMLRERLLQHQNCEIGLREKLAQFEGIRQSIASKSEEVLHAEIANLKTQLSFRDRELLQLHEHLDRLSLLKSTNLHNTYQCQLSPLSNVQSTEGDSSASKYNNFNSNLRSSIMKSVVNNDTGDHSAFPLLNYKASMTRTWKSAGKSSTINNLYSALESFNGIFATTQNHYWATMQKEFTKQLKVCNGNNFDRINITPFLQVIEIIIKEIITNILRSKRYRDPKKSNYLVPYLRYVLCVLTIVTECHSSLANYILMQSDVELALVQEQQNV